MEARSQDSPDRAESLPLGQRIYDNTLLLFVVSVVVMLALFTVWGLVEVWTLPTATLP